MNEDILPDTASSLWVNGEDSRTLDLYDLVRDRSISDALDDLTFYPNRKAYRAAWPEGQYLTKEDNTLVKSYADGSKEPWFVTHEDIIMKDWRIKEC